MELANDGSICSYLSDQPAPTSMFRPSCCASREDRSNGRRDTANSVESQKNRKTQQKLHKHIDGLTFASKPSDAKHQRHIDGLTFASSAATTAHFFCSCRHYSLSCLPSIALSSHLLFNCLGCLLHAALSYSCRIACPCMVLHF